MAKQKKNKKQGNGVIYTALFLNRKELYRLFPAALGKTVEFPHMTVKFRPEDAHAELFGTEAELKVVGYGNNGRCEGLKVEAVSGSEELNALLEEIPVQHITLSTGNGGKPVETSGLEFAPVGTPVVLKGTFGGFVGAGVKLRP